MDGILKAELEENGQPWYPVKDLNVILSQQLSGSLINTPQTTYFNWVKVREFFKAPKITCPTSVCSSGSASLDVDQNATNITWVVGPSNLFSGSTSGQGINAQFTTASGQSGIGTIVFNFYVNGESFSAEKDFIVGSPAPLISNTWSESCNCYVSDPLSTGITYDWQMITSNPSSSSTDYQWEVSGYELPWFTFTSTQLMLASTSYPYTAYGKVLSYTFDDAQYY